MLPNINPYKDKSIMKTIEAKISQQSQELANRAKVIEELKVSLVIFIDKYNDLKKHSSILM
jgi:hypothetical protein